MPDGSTVTEKFSVPLNYHQKEIEHFARRKDNTVLVYTHVEIDPQLILGVCGDGPIPEHNSTPRVTGGTAMVKSLGLPSANYRLRPDTRAHVMHYPQVSVVGTRAMDTTNFNSRPVVRTL